MIPISQKAVPAASESQTLERVNLSRSKAKKRRSENLTGYLFISPWLICFFVFTVVPIVASFVLSFTEYDILSAPVWVGLDNFKRMLFKDARYWKSVMATFYYVFTAIPLRLAFALLVAILLNNKHRFTPFYRAAFYAPSIIGGSIAVAVMWRQVFGREGLVNFITAFLGIPAVNWLGNPSTAIWTLIILAIWQFGSPMLIFLAGLKQIPQELYEASSIDGASSVAKFFKITLPMLSPVIFFNLVMQTISGFLVFTQAFIITSGAPLDTTLFYALYLYRRAFETFEMGYASAMAWALLLIIGIFTAITFKFSSYWVYYEQKES
jgi:multiple sugar transport system permease protein